MGIVYKMVGEKVKKKHLEQYFSFTRNERGMLPCSVIRDWPKTQDNTCVPWVGSYLSRYIASCHILSFFPL